MSEEDIKRKNIVLIKYLQSLNLDSNLKFKAEYSTNDNDLKVVVVQEVMGEKVIFYEDTAPMFNYYSIQIFSDTISNAKNISVDIGNLIGKSVLYEIENKDKIETWQIIFQQLSNPQAIEYQDIRRVGYTATMKCIVNMVSKRNK